MEDLRSIPPLCIFSVSHWNFTWVAVVPRIFGSPDLLDGSLFRERRDGRADVCRHFFLSRGAVLPRIWVWCSLGCERLCSLSVLVAGKFSNFPARCLEVHCCRVLTSAGACCLSQLARWGVGTPKAAITWRAGWHLRLASPTTERLHYTPRKKQKNHVRTPPAAPRHTFPRGRDPKQQARRAAPPPPPRRRARRARGAA